MTDLSFLEIDLSRPLCAVHLKMVAEAELPALPVALEALFRMFEDDVFLQACGRNVLTGQKADARQIPVLLKQLGPPCCFLGETFPAVLTDAKAGDFPATRRTQQRSRAAIDSQS